MRTIWFIAIASILILFTVVPTIVNNAYSHGVSSGGPGGFPYIRLNNEQFSDQTVDTGHVIKIKGTLVSTILKHTFKLYPYVSVSTGQPFDSFDINGFPRLYYPFYDSEESWYFKIDSNLTNPVVLEPTQKINYEIRVYPLKAGTYHIHSYFISDEGIDRIGPGQTVQVSGNAMPTSGELIGFYLPLAIGAASLIVLILKARRTARNLGFGRIRRGIKIFFAVKSSIEAIWLTGLVVWVVTVAYHVLQPFETRLLSVIAMTGLIAAITVSGYITTVSKARKLQNSFAISLAIVSAIFYLFLLFGPLYYLATPAFGYNRNPFHLDPLFLFISIFTNASVAGLLLWKRKESNISSLSTNELATRQ